MKTIKTKSWVEYKNTIKAIKDEFKKAKSKFQFEMAIADNEYRKDQAIEDAKKAQQETKK